jgi:hypothetical protein
MPTNNRIFYATQLINLNPCDTTALAENVKGGESDPTFYTPRGVQTLGITTNFNLTEVFSIGQLEVYDQPEDLPDIEVSMTKVFDGTPPLYFLVMQGSGGGIGVNETDFDLVNNKALTEIGNNRVNVHVGIYPDTAESAFEAPQDFIAMSGMYLSSFTYTLGVDDNFTEDISLVGNHKTWANNGTGFGNADDSRNVFGTGVGNSARSSVFTARRMNIATGLCQFPTGVGGIHSPGNALPYFQNITISSDLGREEIRQLGRFDPYYRYITFPTEVTAEFEVIASEGDFLNADDFRGQDPCSSNFTQLQDKPINLVVCTNNGSLRFDLGEKNKITSVNYGGGDAGGDNVTLSYSFRNFNSFKLEGSGSFASGGLCLSTSDVLPSA